MRHRSNTLFLQAAVAMCFATPVAFAQAVITLPSNPIVGIAATPGNATSALAVVGTNAGQNNYPAAEPPTAAIDGITSVGNPSNKYLNFAQTNVGFIVTPSALTFLTGFQFYTGNDAPERDPVVIVIEGTNSPNATTTLNSTWVQIFSGGSGLATNPGRDTFGNQVNFANALSYASYRVLVTAVRDTTAANSMQFGEIRLVGTPVPEPSSMALCGLVAGLAVRRLRRKS